MTAANYHNYRKKHAISKKACADFVNSVFFTEASKGQRTAMLITLRSMLSSYTFTDYITCRKAVELSGIGKTTYAEAKSIMIESDCFNVEHKAVNRRRFQIMLTPKVLGQPRFIKDKTHEQFYQNRFYCFNSKSDVEFIEYLNSENNDPFIFESEKADTINHKSVMDSEWDTTSLFPSSDLDVLGVEESNTVDSNNFSEIRFKPTIYAENSDFWHSMVIKFGDKYEADILKLQKDKLELAKVLEYIGFRCFPVISGSKELGQKASIKHANKEKRIRNIYKTILAQDYPKTDVDKGLRVWLGDEMFEYYDNLENQEDIKAVRSLGSWRSRFNTAWACKDMGAFMGEKLVCLDCDDKETFNLVLGMLPKNTLAQNTRRGGHIFIKDSRKVLKNIVKIGNIDVIQGNAGVKIWDTAGIYDFIQGDLADMYVMQSADLSNLQLYLTNNTIIYKTKEIKDLEDKGHKFNEKPTFIQTVERKECLDARKCAVNVLNVLQGKEDVAYKIPEGYRNNTLMKILATVRAWGYDQETLEKVALLVDVDYFEGADDAGQSYDTLKSILRGKNRGNFEQKVEMFTRRLNVCEAYKKLEFKHKFQYQPLPPILQSNSKNSKFFSD